MAGLHEVGDDRECLNNTPSSCSLIVELIIVTKTDPELGVIRDLMRLEFRCFGRDAIKQLKRIGPRTLPFGTPTLEHMGSERSLSVFYSVKPIR